MGQSVGDLPPELRDAVVSRLSEAPVRLALLFGSYATAEATNDSDVDIAVAYESETEVSDTHLSLVGDLTRILGRDDVDVLRLTEVDPRIATEALDTGQILVGSRKVANQLRAQIESERRKREQTVQTRISDAERAIEERLEQREHG